MYIETPILQNCLINLPEKIALADVSKLVIGLHGGGGNAEKFISLWDTISNREFIFAVPQAPYPLLVEKELKYEWALWPSSDSEIISKATALSENYIIQVVGEVSKEFNINEVYLLGFSQGAVFSYLVGLKYSKLFKGVIILSGPGLLTPLNNPFANFEGENWLAEKNIQNSNQLRIFITHGKLDKAAGYQLGIKSKNVLENHQYDVTFRDFEGGHKLPPAEILQQIADWVVTPI